VQRISNEACLINALINTDSPEAAKLRGIDPEMFVAFKSEYRWLLNYKEAYDSTPSINTLLTKFPTFPVQEERDVDFYCDEVRYAYTARELSRTLTTAAQHLSQDDLESAVFAVSTFSPPSQKGVPLTNTLTDDSFLENWDTAEETYKVPWQTLDDATGGLHKGDLWYVAGRLGQGKSWSLGCFARTLALSGKRVLFVSLEMSERQVQQRLHIMLGNTLGSKITHSELRNREITPQQYSELMSLIRTNVTGSVSVLDFSRGPVTPAKIQSMIKDYDAAVIDYAGLMSSSMGNRAVEDWRTMAAISNQLKEVAVATDIPIVAAAQINREGDTNNWKPPKVKNLSQSDALGQDGDVVLTQKQYGKKNMVYSLEKNRHGEGQQLFFTEFDPNKGRFEEVSAQVARQSYERYKMSEADIDDIYA
jgi:replicative DNA helicase